MSDQAGEPSGETSAEDEEVLTTWEKWKKKVSSKWEWEAYILRKLEKKEQAEAGTAPAKGGGFLEKLKKVFRTSKDRKTFLEEESKNYIKETEEGKVDEETLETYPVGAEKEA